DTAERSTPNGTCHSSDYCTSYTNQPAVLLPRLSTPAAFLSPHQHRRELQPMDKPLVPCLRRHPWRRSRTHRSWNRPRGGKIGSAEYSLRLLHWHLVEGDIELVRDFEDALIAVKFVVDNPLDARVGQHLKTVPARARR